VVDQASVVEAVCRHVGVDQSELDSTTRRAAIARARALIACVATQDLSTPGSEVARRMSIDRSAVSRAVQRVRRDENMMADLKAVWGLLKSAKSQR
jgi:chromosomal replication initiation ATPase DnaA